MNEGRPGGRSNERCEGLLCHKAAMFGVEVVFLKKMVDQRIAQGDQIAVLSLDPRKRLGGKSDPSGNGDTGSGGGLIRVRGGFLS